MQIIKVENDRLIEKVAKLADNIWREHYSSIISKEQIDYMLANFQSESAIRNQISKENYRYYLMENDEELVGYFAVVVEEADLFLSKLYVAKENRHKGYAGGALDFLKQLAKESNLKNIYLTVNRNNVSSITAYGKMGFKNAGEINQNIGDGFKMEDYKMVLEV